MEGWNDLTEIEQASKKREEDLEVYFALNQFARRPVYKHLEQGLRLDIKSFFGNYNNAQASARKLLFSIADTEAIEQACQYAAEHGLGWLEEVAAASFKYG